VKSLERIDQIFETQRRSGWAASQPIEVVGVAFIPEGRTEPVLAVDLIDAESVAGLKVGSAVGVEYEAAEPRTAYVRGARREFLWNNLAVAGRDGFLYVAVFIGFLLGANFIGKAFSRRLERRGPASE
jgi:hypothetical protein